MTIARTAQQLLGQLDDDLAWRLKEVTAMHRAIRDASEASQKALLRASVPLLYAHWEGFIKENAMRYGDYLSRLGLKYGDAKRSFAGISAMTHVQTLNAIRNKIFVAAETLRMLHAIDDSPLKFNLRSQISNIGNMNYDKFIEIVNFLSIDASKYASRKQLIDELLINKRNDIAHGSYLLIDKSDFENLFREIFDLMRQFKIDIQNSLAQKTYLRVAEA